MEEITVSLSLDTIIRECSLNSDLFLDHYYYFMIRNRENVHHVFRYKKFNDDFISKVDCYNDGNNLVGMIRPSYQDFLIKLINILNLSIHDVIVDDDALTQKLLVRVERLKEIKSEYELKKEFPVLYRDLMDGRKYYRDLQKMKKLENYSIDDVASGEHYYYSCGLKKSLPNFIQTQVEVYTRFVLRRKDYKNRLQKMNFNNYLSTHFDINKFYLYVMHEYLLKAENSKNINEKKKYLIFVEKYLLSDKCKDVVITTDSGMKITIDNIINRFNQLRRIINEDYSQVEWILIPSGKDYPRVNKDTRVVSPSITLSLDEYIKLCELGNRKKIFYESSPYLARVIGLKMYNGYVGHIYENGEVILDTEFDESRPLTAKGNAIYNLKVGDFELLSHYDKLHLRKHPRVGVMNHSKTWEKRVSDIISREATEEEKKTTHQLIKRLKEKNEFY